MMIKTLYFPNTKQISIFSQLKTVQFYNQTSAGEERKMMGKYTSSRFPK